MNLIRLMTPLVVLMAGGYVSAQSPITLAEASQLASEQNKPILIEFHRDG